MSSTKIHIFLAICLMLLAGYQTGAQPPAGKDTARIMRMITTAQQLLRTGHTDSGRQYFAEALQDSRHTRYAYGTVMSLTGLGVISGTEGDYPAALAYFDEALLHIDTGSERYNNQQAILHSNIGGIYQAWGEYAQSMIHLEKAVRIKEMQEQNKGLEELYNNIAAVLIETRQPDKALYFIEKGFHIASGNGDTNNLIRLMINQGIALSALNQLHGSDSVFRAVLEINKHSPVPGMIQLVYRSQGEIALKKGQYHQAVAYLEKARDHALPDPFSLNSTLLMLARSYLRIGSYDKAEATLREALLKAEHHDILADRVLAHGFLAELYAARGDYPNAYAARQEQQYWNDSLGKRANRQLTNQIEARYRTALLGKELAEQQLTIRTQENSIYIRNIWIGITIAGMLLLLLLIILITRSNRHKQRLKDEKVTNLIRQQELSEIKAVMNGEEKERVRLARDIHDGIMVQFSSVMMKLNAILEKTESPAVKQELQQLEDHLDKATSSLRKTAHSLMPDMLLEEGISEALYYFCNTLQQDLSLRILFDQNGIPPRYEVQFELSVYRIVQELLQNIVKHAGATEAIVQVDYRDEVFYITVEDNGKGMDNSDTEKTEGMGLRSIRARMLALGGKMEIESSKGIGTAVHLEFDRSKKNKES